VALAVLFTFPVFIFFRKSEQPSTYILCEVVTHGCLPNVVIIVTVFHVTKCGANDRNSILLLKWFLQALSADLYRLMILTKLYRCVTI
jgi:hypothetical protein